MSPVTRFGGSILQSLIELSRAIQDEPLSPADKTEMNILLNAIMSSANVCMKQVNGMEE